MDAQPVLHLPLAFHTEDALVDVSSDVRVYVQVKLAYSDFVDEGVNLTLKCIRKEDTRLDGSFSETGGAGLFDVNAHGGSDTLTGNLHQSKLGKRQDIVLGAVFLHVFAHALVEHLAVFRMRRSVPHGIACLLTAAAVGADALTKQTGAVTGGSAGLQKAYTVSAFAAALVFLLDGVVFLSGAAFGKKLRILRLVPVLWAFFLTIGYFAVTASYLHSTQLMLTIFGDAFLMIYLFEYARKAAGINAAENSAVFCATGLVAAVLLTAASLPALLLKLTAGAQIAYCPFLWYHLACAAFCVTSLCLRREDADAADVSVPTAPFPAEDAPAEEAPAQDAPET